MFPEIKSRGLYFGEGPIQLRWGEHRGSGRGFGLLHIWEAHFYKHSSVADALPVVVSFLDSILQPGTPIHHEPDSSKYRKAALFKGKAGIAVVQERYGASGELTYSIVTAYPAKKVNGPRVGAIQVQGLV